MKRILAIVLVVTLFMTSFTDCYAATRKSKEITQNLLFYLLFLQIIKKEPNFFVVDNLKICEYKNEIQYKKINLLYNDSLLYHNFHY